ncbi:unknown [Clostridium sp. CAG:149]|nr:unknown [Clostridium sp. CAG:149]
MVKTVYCKNGWALRVHCQCKHEQDIKSTFACIIACKLSCFLHIAVCELDNIARGWNISIDIAFLWGGYCNISGPVNHIKNIVHVEISKIHFIILRVNQCLEGFRKAAAIQPNRSRLIRIRCSATQCNGVRLKYTVCRKILSDFSAGF